MFTVHTIPGSPFARAVLATLEEKRAPYRVAPVRPGEHKQAAHLARHPFGRVPVLTHDGFELFETQAILRYIDRVVPEPALSPADPRCAARMDQIMGIADWYLFPVSAVICFQRVVGPKLLGTVPDEPAIAAALPAAHTVFAALDALLCGPFVTGETLTLADLLLAAHLDFFVVTPEWRGLTASRPRLAAWLGRMTARESLAATTWDRVSAMAEAA